MAFGTAKHGVNGLAYVSGGEIEGASAWSVAIDTQSAEYVKFGDDWVNRVPGVNDWRASLTAWHDQDAKKLQDAAVARVAVAVLIYPDRADLTTYYNGSGIFSFTSEGNTTSVVGQTANIVGDGELSLTGFS